MTDLAQFRVTIQFFCAPQILNFLLIFVLFSSFSLEGIKKKAQSLYDSESKRGYGGLCSGHSRWFVPHRNALFALVVGLDC